METTMQMRLKPLIVAAATATISMTMLCNIGSASANDRLAEQSSTQRASPSIPRLVPASDDVRTERGHGPAVPASSRANGGTVISCGIGGCTEKQPGKPYPISGGHHDDHGGYYDKAWYRWYKMYHQGGAYPVYDSDYSSYGHCHDASWYRWYSMYHKHAPYSAYDSCQKYYWHWSRWEYWNRYHKAG
jgi:hypothetical protein